MQLLQPFNANDFDPTQTAGSLPVGRHPVVIETSEVKANAKNDGGYLQLNLKVTDGPNAGATGAMRLNLYHSNPQTVDIANRQFSALCHSVGVFMVNDSSQLHGIPFVVEVQYQKGHEPGSSPDAKGYTEIKKVFDRNGNEPGKAGAQTTAHNTAQGQAPQQQQQQQQAQWGQAPQQQQQQQQAQWGQAPQQQQQQQQAQWGQAPQQQAGGAPAKAPWA